MMNALPQTIRRHGIAQLLRAFVRRAWVLGGVVLAVTILTGQGSSAVAAGSDKAPALDGRLEELDRELRKSRKSSESLKQKSSEIARDIHLARQQRVASAKALHLHETKVLELEDRLSELRREEDKKMKRLGLSRERHGEVLMALQRLARNPPEAMIAQPLSPNDMVRSAILLRAAVPGIEKFAKRLRDDLAGLAVSKREIAFRVKQLDSARAGMEGNRKRLDALLKTKGKQRLETESQRKKAIRRLKKLAGEANNVRDLVRRLEADRKKQEARALREKKRRTKARAKAAARTKAAQKKAPPEQTAALVSPDMAALPKGGKPFSEARGSLPYPVVGRLFGRYGQVMKSGLTRKGIEIETRHGARVIAPYDGRVVFAGRFRGYGQLLIIDHGEGYHSLLAGLNRIDGVIGQWVLAGEPVGVMGRPEGTYPSLYVELRRDSQPINPFPWLVARKSRVNG